LPVPGVGAVIAIMGAAGNMRRKSPVMSALIEY